MKNRTKALADRLEQGSRALATFVSTLTEDEWQMQVPHDGRKVGVTVHHVASMYPLEIALAEGILKGDPQVGVTWDAVADINAKHAREFDTVTKEQALDLLTRNSTAAADAIRALNDEDIDRAVTLSLYQDAPLTAGFWLEDHPVRHAYHHLGKIRAALKQASVGV